MDAVNILQHKALKSSFIKDPRRKKALSAAVTSLVQREELTVTGLGRGLRNSKARCKHNIKRMDRLLSNPHLHAERISVYYGVAHWLLKQHKHPLIIVDWSPVNHVDFQILRASLPIGGRAFTLYEQVFPERDLASVKSHRSFITKLAAILPEGCKPVICTDAGFYTPWFTPVEEQGWYWLSRLRGNSLVHANGEWQSVAALYLQATAMPAELGDILLTKTRQHPCRAALNRRASKGRHKKVWSGGPSRDSSSLEYARAAKEPWLLVTNLPADQWPAEQMVGLYAKRMQIEEGFRDTKSYRTGLGLRLSGTRDVARLQVLLLIAMLTQLTLLIIGKAAYLKEYHRHFQANTERDRAVLSYFFLGKEIVKDARYQFSEQDLAEAYDEMSKNYAC